MCARARGCCLSFSAAPGAFLCPRKQASFGAKNKTGTDQRSQRVGLSGCYSNRSAELRASWAFSSAKRSARSSSMILSGPTTPSGHCSNFVPGIVSRLSH